MNPGGQLSLPLNRTQGGVDTPWLCQQSHRCSPARRQVGPPLALALSIPRPRRRSTSPRVRPPSARLPPFNPPQSVLLSSPKAPPQPPSCCSSSCSCASGEDSLVRGGVRFPSSRRTGIGEKFILTSLRGWPHSIWQGDELDSGRRFSSCSSPDAGGVLLFFAGGDASGEEQCCGLRQASRASIVHRPLPLLRLRHLCVSSLPFFSSGCSPAHTTSAPRRPSPADCGPAMQPACRQANQAPYHAHNGTSHKEARPCARAPASMDMANGQFFGVQIFVFCVMMAELRFLNLLAP